MSDFSWQMGPLGEEIESYLGLRGPGDRWMRAYANWNQMSVVFLDPSRWSEFRNRLSISQLNSYQLLLEWWTGKYQTQVLSNAARKSISSLANGTLADLQIPNDLRPDESRYHAQLFELFRYEFFFYGRSTAAPIQIRRHSAAIIASCQRLAYSLHKSSCPTCDGLHLVSGAPDLLRTAPPDVAQLAEVQSSQFDGDVGATIEPCPWLPVEKKTGLPFYLWDLQNRCTVVAEELDSKPQYTVISHTWGRWRTKGLGVSIPNVPWIVPQNTRFSVEDLPEILHRHTFGTPYVWLDLLCIPQDRSHRAIIEISRQAVIFGAATMAVAWLNDIDCWKSTQAGLKWLALTFLKGYQYQTCPNNEPLLLEIAKQATSTTQLIETRHHTTGQAQKAVRPSGWFTSLWTLQEVCLRPDMKFLNRNCELLCLTDGIPIPLDSILALEKFFQGGPAWDLHDVTPPAVTELTSVITDTCLDQLLEISPIGVIILGNRRYCEERRAEAIMSVIGATNWYTSGTEEDFAEKDLVLGKYPIEFLREIRKNIGASFFSSNYGDCCFWDIFRTGEDGVTDTVAGGTLLPYGLVSPVSKVATAARSPEWQEHPAVETWKLLDDGRVLMAEAGIVASTDERYNTDSEQELICTILGPASEDDPRKIGPIGLPGGLPQEMSLHEYLTSIFPGAPKHAVCLWQSPSGWSQGFILMQVYEGEEKILAKFGDYYTGDREHSSIPESRQVGWEVL